MKELLTLDAGRAHLRRRCPANKGCASIAISTLTAAGSPHTITADFLGDSTFDISNGSVSQTVNRVGYVNGNFVFAKPVFRQSGCHVHRDDHVTDRNSAADRHGAVP